MNRKIALQLSLAGLMAALVCVFTAFFKIPSQIGYMHLGDGFVLSAGVFLGPYGIAAAGIGSSLADIISGYAVYAAPTFFIKCLTSFLAFAIHKKFKDNIALMACGLILTQATMTALYFAFEWVWYGIEGAVSGVLFTSIQAVVGVVLGLLLIKLLEKLKTEIKL